MKNLKLPLLISAVSSVILTGLSYFYNSNLGVGDLGSGLGLPLSYAFYPGFANVPQVWTYNYINLFVDYIFWLLIVFVILVLYKKSHIKK